ncbi:hypothetical protein BJ875DRAFT_248428 [Amylocarpus encephaloides]|uniref:THUMP domain-containing protein n=1 Tax=Amylocarpus encephaloides TaxID=45428 RepID=A0A9P7YN02_9HELO|nr:hypothetical protein BJ875DRAFT_248428 [Amylocarpus encephaloides]
MAPGKRKKTPNGNDGAKGAKRSKGASGGRWQTPNQKAKVEAFRERGSIEPGDSGIWVTCARGQEARATTELKSLMYEFAEKFYGLSEEPEEGDGVEDDGDIESSIKKEAAAMGDTNRKPRLFSTVRLGIECVLFFKVQPSIDPVDICRRICEEVASNSRNRRTRYINRITPVTLIGKATEKGLEELTSTILKDHFTMVGVEAADSATDVQPADSESEPKQDSHTYAIRPTIRNHNKPLKRDVVIQQIASSIGDAHKVNLTKPDKVIIVEVYQTVCGMSVMGNDWERLKRYNLAELYQPAKLPAPTAEAMQKSVKKDEASTTGSTATDSTEPKV